MSKSQRHNQPDGILKAPVCPLAIYRVQLTMKSNLAEKKSFCPSVSTNNWNAREVRQAVRLTNLWTVKWNIPHTHTHFNVCYEYLDGLSWCSASPPHSRVAKHASVAVPGRRQVNEIKILVLSVRKQKIMFA